MSNFDLIKDFHTKFDPVGTGEDKEALVERRMMYLVEEVRETVDAAEEFLDATPEDMKKTKAHLAKELVDVLAMTYGFLHMLGVDADAAFAEVHASNMSKTPNPGGKATKGDGYKNAKMEKFV